MHTAMTSQDASKPKICGKSVAIPKICDLLRKLRSLLDFAINSAIAESQNPGGTGKCCFMLSFKALEKPHGL